MDTTQHSAKQACGGNKAPKSVVAEITKEEGGIQCRSSSCLPRNRRHIINAQGSKSNKDQLHVVMDMCMKSKCEGEKFVHCVQAAPEPSCVLALEQQLLDIERFCTCKDEFTVLGFDPTFNYGNFRVTVTAYRHLMLERIVDGSVPTFIGPMLVHQQKLKESYNCLIYSIIGAHSPLSRILAVGTDGESNLFAAILNNLPFAQHVRCAVHMKRDIQEKMKDLGAPKQYQSLFLEDIMGSFYSPHATGLVDATTNEEFDETLSSLQSIWQKREQEYSSRSPVLYQWFVKYHAEEVHNFMIVLVRERVGLGTPPSHFTTNANESINNAVKQALHYEERNWDTLCNEIFNLVKVQYQELEKAIVRTGEYRFQAIFAYLEKPVAMWSKMSTEQRRRHINKVMCAKMDSAPTDDSDDNTTMSRCEVTPLAAPSNVSSEIWERMVSIAQAIASDPVSMSPVPGGNEKSRIVVSFRNPSSPLKVQAGKSPGQYTCDKKKCPVFAGYRICSHVLVLALHNNESEELLKNSQSSDNPSLHDVAMIGMPRNTGEKKNHTGKRNAIRMKIVCQLVVGAQCL